MGKKRPQMGGKKERGEKIKSLENCLMNGHKFIRILHYDKGGGEGGGRRSVQE